MMDHISETSHEQQWALIAKTSDDMSFPDYIGLLTPPAGQAKAAGEPTTRKDATADIAPVTFLRTLDPIGYHHLVALDPAKELPPIAKTFTPDAWDEIQRFVDQHNGTRNLYFSPNEPRADAPDRKLAKSDVDAVRAVYVDIDPVKSLPLADERTRLLALVGEWQKSSNPPTFIIDSGGGFQMLWQLSEKVALPKPGATDREAAQQLWEKLGCNAANATDGDSIQNVDRVLRLPGTINIPDAAKAAAGRVCAAARLLSSRGRTYDRNQLVALFPPAAVKLDGALCGTDDRQSRMWEAEGDLDWLIVIHADDYAGLNADLRQRFERARRDVPTLEALWTQGEVPAGADRTHSGLRVHLANALRRYGGFNVNDFGALLHVWSRALAPGGDLTERMILRDWTASDVREPPKVEDFLDVLADITEQQAPDNSFSARPVRGRLRERLRTRSDRMAATEAEPTPPLVEGLLDTGTMSVLYAPSNAGKTFVAIDIAFAVSQGRQWAGGRTTKTGVLYVAGEGGRSLDQRATALETVHGHSDADAAFLTLPAHVNLMELEDVDELADIAREHSVGMIVIDTLARAFGSGDENSTPGMNAFIAAVNKLQTDTGAHVMVVHHSGKDVKRGARGNTALRAAVDTEIEIVPDGGEPGVGVIVVRKQRDMDGNWRRAFRLEPVMVHAGRSHVSTCVARVDGAWCAKAPELSEPSKRLLDVLVHLATVNGVGQTPKAIAAHLKTPDKTESIRKILGRLKNKGLVVNQGDGTWRPKDKSSQRCVSQESLITDLDAPSKAASRPATTAHPKRRGVRRADAKRTCEEQEILNKSHVVMR